MANQLTAKTILGKALEIEAIGTLFAAPGKHDHSITFRDMTEKRH